MLLIQLQHFLCQQIDQPNLLIPIEWNSKTNKSQVKAQVDYFARLLLIQEISFNEYSTIYPYYYCINLLSPLIQTLRPFLASCQRYLALLGATSSSSMIHEGTFMSLSSELAVTAAPLHYRLSQGQLYKRMTLKELQVQNSGLLYAKYCVQIHCNNTFSLCKSSHRARPLLLTGCAVCRLFSIHCLSLQMIMSFCIIYPTLCICPPSLGNG